MKTPSDALAWLMGARVIEQDDEHIIIKVPGWLGEDGPQKVIERVMPDVKVKHPAARATIGRRLVRIDLRPDV